MPSSGYGLVDLIGEHCNDQESQQRHYDKVKRLCLRAKLAMDTGMFTEWLESFLAAWEETKDVDIASFAGLEEWDL